MNDPRNEDNPYRSPSAIDRLVLRRRTFQIGREELQTLHVDASLWSGVKSYTVDALGRASPITRGPRQFEVGQHEVHMISIEVDSAARVNVLVDGELLAANLFPRLSNTVIAVVLILVVGGLIFTMASVIASKLIMAP